MLFPLLTDVGIVSLSGISSAAALLVSKLLACRGVDFDVSSPGYCSKLNRLVEN
jgi:hypothetical protein